MSILLLTLIKITGSSSDAPLAQGQGLRIQSKPTCRLPRSANSKHYFYKSHACPQSPKLATNISSFPHWGVRGIPMACHFSSQRSRWEWYYIKRMFFERRIELQIEDGLTIRRN